MKRLATLFLCMFLLLNLTLSTQAEELSEDYQLEQLVIMSRHNIRAPQTKETFQLSTYSPLVWTDWGVNGGELTFKGAATELRMGQYFRQYMEKSGLIPNNWQPSPFEVRFYANGYQRTMATARAFATGMAPIGQIELEVHAELGKHDPVFKPMIRKWNEELDKIYHQDAADRIAPYTVENAAEAVADNIAYMCEILECDPALIPLDDGEISFKAGEEPELSGGLKTANLLADALMMQYYETGMAFGNPISDEEMQAVMDICNWYAALVQDVPTGALNAASPLIREMQAELNIPYRKIAFLCGHDSDVLPILKVLGLTPEELPDTFNPDAPIGVKIVLEHYKNTAGEDFIRPVLTYPGNSQILSEEALTLDNPPRIVYLDFASLIPNEDGMYRFEEVMDLMDQVLDDYEALGSNAEQTMESEEALPDAA